MHRFIKRQLRKHFGEDYVLDDKMKQFLLSIDISYKYLDSNKELFQRAMDLSSEELFNSNQKLQEESERHHLLLNSLRESVTAISPDTEINEEDILKIADLLKSEIVKRKLVEEELNTAREIAITSLKSKEMFFANMSHEIRTPMNGIIGMARLLKETELDEVQSKYRQIIQSSAEDLMVIINDILDITKISSGNFSLEEANFDLSQAINDVAKLLVFKAEEKEINLNVAVDPSISGHHKGDPIRLKQILFNLVGNAIKFTQDGGVHLEAKLIKHEDQSDSIQFTVRDSGIGIDENKLDTIFESFTQEDSSTTRKFGGTGLGLSISRQLVKAFGGDLCVESTKGQGTTFFFTLELEQTPFDLIKEEVSAEHKDLNNLKILVADDNEVNVILASTVLTNWNSKVVSAENGQEVLEKLKEEGFDVILMDMQMPLMNGLEATSHIREELGSDIPIIGLTANALKGERENCIDAGMDEYITKPFDPEELYQKIVDLVEKDC